MIQACKKSDCDRLRHRFRATQCFQLKLKILVVLNTTGLILEPSATHCVLFLIAAKHRAFLRSYSDCFFNADA
ncbi:hypothetical protein Pla22_29760 [Rubripirellula amarantea]|uniref:Uncharacterized protein n=1 Tax=Rubripirellula amarantea TaxID=2527999 RepID=A0A5C5WJD7_9BACT|nr:hypothetical protein Pla22_29760 [Rubripirellula amarantea]